VVEPAAIGDQHRPLGHRFEDVGDAAAHGHRLTARIEPVAPHHPALGQDQHHRIGIDAAEHRLPGVVALARDGDDVGRMKEEPSDHRPVDVFSAAGTTRGWLV
jgi:hypothetical protein